MSKTKTGSNATFTGPQQGITFVGNYAYAYSGGIQSATSNTTHLDFTIGSRYVVGKFHFTGAVKIADPGGGEYCVAQLSFNDQVVALLKVDTATEDSPGQATMPLIIPPHTKVNVVVNCSGSTADFLTSVSITGKVHNG
jgi:hypothetical protein